MTGERESARAAIFERAPAIAAAAAMAVGMATVIAVAMPALPHLPALAALDRFVAEFPELGASAGGVALMALASGLRARLDAAWAAGVLLLAGAAGYAFFRHEHVVAASVAGLAAAALALARPAFYRHSHLTRLAPGAKAVVAIAFALAAAVAAGLLWAGERPGFAEAPFWALLANSDLGRPGRVLLAAAMTLAALILWRFLLSRPKRAPPPPDDSDIARAAALLAGAQDAQPEAHLALAGDKSFLFVDGAFVMTARAGSSLIAMGGPVGRREAWRDALVALRKAGEEMSLRPVVYAAPPELLPDLLDLGFDVKKMGENAVVDLARFTLSGKARQDLRTARRRFVEREAADFEVLAPPHDPALWDDLRPVSDAWLAAHGGSEKSFSLGRFDPAYLARQPIARIRAHGRTIAFANLWTTPDGARAALDLMRFDPERAPAGVMDFLITEILLWAQGEHFRTFDLGMAPLAGLAEDEYAPLFARLGKLVFTHAESIYGFQGLRRFKEKFGPDWSPRYLAAPGAWSMPIVLAEAALLTSGGVSGLLRRPAKTPSAG